MSAKQKENPDSLEKLESVIQALKARGMSYFEAARQVLGYDDAPTIVHETILKQLMKLVGGCRYSKTACEMLWIVNKHQSTNQELQNESYLKLLGIAQGYFDDGNLEEAEALYYDIAVEGNHSRDRKKAWYQLLYIAPKYLQNGQSQNAEEVCLRILNRGHIDRVALDALEMVANWRFDNGEFEKAWELCDYIFENSHQHTSIRDRILKGRINKVLEGAEQCAEKGEFKKAFGGTNFIMKIFSTDKITSGTSTFYNYMEAENEALNMKGDICGLALQRAGEYLDEGDLEQALQVYQLVLNQGICHVPDNKYKVRKGGIGDGLRNGCDFYHKSNVESVDGIFEIGDKYHKLGNLDQALECYLCAGANMMPFNRDQERVLENWVGKKVFELVDPYLDKDNPDKALESWNSIPSFYDIEEKLVVATYSKIGDKYRAQQHVENALECYRLGWLKADDQSDLFVKKVFDMGRQYFQNQEWQLAQACYLWVIDVVEDRRQEKTAQNFLDHIQNQTDELPMTYAGALLHHKAC